MSFLYAVMSQLFNGVFYGLEAIVPDNYSFCGAEG